MDLNQARWRKSSYSANGGGECVEIAHLNAVAVRDSKEHHRPHPRRPHPGVARLPQSPQPLMTLDH
ncbi:MAG TPA: DUF397 domain-containing protein [Pseudonocardiaceae bacterium]|nr:DUF397 domain-containing protein [Pseudonocardiaceae bacterium]